MRRMMLGCAAQIMRHLGAHPHIVRLVDVYEDKKELHMVMQLCCGGELFQVRSSAAAATHHVRWSPWTVGERWCFASPELRCAQRLASRKRLTEFEAAKCMYAIMRVLQHCHSMNVVHRDVKPENFLVRDPPRALGVPRTTTRCHVAMAGAPLLTLLPAPVRAARDGGLLAVVRARH